MIKKVIFAFLISLIFLAILGFVSINKLLTLSDLNTKLYEHPFVVSNATRTIQTNIVSMHRYMKDIANAENTDEIKKTKQLIKANQKIIFKQFDIIFKKYLGNTKDIQTSYDMFVNWEPIRNEVISLIQKNKRKEAFAITKGKGLKYINRLDKEINKLIIFANNKADSFHNKTLQARDEAVKFILILLAVISLISFSLFAVLLLQISARDKKINEYFHLIDENIMNVVINSQHKIIDASSALSNFMKLSRTELLKTPNYFLLSECSQDEIAEISKITQSGRSWKGEIKKHVDGEIKWLESSIHPTASDKDRYTNILNDITDKKQFERLSKVDALTGLYNRRFFNKVFPDIIRILKRSENILTFVMIDIDYFKQYNDTYGHQKGDIALQQVAHTIKSHITRPDDYAFRLGGEEFAILFHSKKEENALPFVEKLHKKVIDLQIEHKTNPDTKVLTLSMGMYLINSSDNSTIEEIYKKTDDLLYKAKQNGRNNIQV